MKRLRFLAAIVFVLVLTGSDAYAICQKCQNNFSTVARCWTLGPCEFGATMSACVVRQFQYDPDTLWCDSLGTSAGAECNGQDSSCGGGDGGGPGGGSGGGGGCVIQYGQTCPAQCSSCTYEDVW